MHGRTALVTGGSKGIGRAVVMALADQGAHVWFTYRTQDDSVTTLDAWARERGLSVDGIVCDHQREGDDERVWASIGTRGMLDILVNNVGDAVRRCAFLEGDAALWEETFRVNVWTTVATTQRCLSWLLASPHAAIVNVSSIAGTTGGGADSLHYAAAKGAVHTLTKGLANELTPKGIRVNAVAPSAIDTPFQARHSSPERLERIVRETPMKRIGTAEEVAAVVAFLVSDAASYISGEVIHITGGR